MEQKSSAIEKLLAQYLYLPIAGRKIRCPYWMNILHPNPKKGKKKVQGVYGGKGTPAQIRYATQKKAKLKGVDLVKLSSSQVKKFMKRNRIGVDCSGFVYHALNVRDKELGGKGIDGLVFGKNKNKIGVRHVNAYHFTSPRNSIEVKSVKEMKVGDMIRFKRGAHIGIIVKISPKKIFYAHSSPPRGPHLGEIRIIDFNKGLGRQVWLEKTARGENYGQKYFHPEKGDEVRRLKVWQD